MKAPVLAVSIATLLGIGLACQPRPRPNLPSARPQPPGQPAPVPAPATPAPAPPNPAPPAAIPIPPETPAGALPPLTAPPLDEAARASWLQASLDALFGTAGSSPPALRGAQVSVQVVEAENGQTIYAREPKALLNAASNVKLVTAAAALGALGPEFQFRTVVYGPAKGEGRPLQPNGDLSGDIYLRGGGDPTLTGAGLTELAQQLFATGLRRVRGAIVVDRSYFGDQEMPPLYDSKDESAAFRAPSSAASLAGNAVAVTVAPGSAAGAEARVFLAPPSDYLLLAGRIVTTDIGPAIPVIETADNGDGRTLIKLSGRVDRAAEPRTYLRRIAHPALFLGGSFRAVLEKIGIKVTEPVRIAPAPEGLRVLASHASPPLGVIVQDLDKRSNNFTAEQILRTLGAETQGAPGTWDKGIEAVARFLDRIGVKRGSYRLENASGLYDSNRFSAEQIVRIIRTAMRDFRIAGEFLASLAVAGSDGTLIDRMGGTPAERYLRGKTGTLLGTSCLSGVVGAPGRKPLVFSILMNQVSDTLRARAVQDQAGAALAWFLEPPGAPPPTAAAAPGTD